MTDKLLVVSAHIADWVWRCSGTVAKYRKQGAEVCVVCLTLGARGESRELWKSPDATTEEVKRIRLEEAELAAKKLGVNQFEAWDFDDCPLAPEREIFQKLNAKIREVQPSVIITHDRGDDTNLDHGAAFEITLQASLMSRQRGVETEGLETSRIVQIYGMEPSQPERSGFVPQVYIDVTEVYEEKMAAMACCKSQPNNPGLHTLIADRRGRQAAAMPGGKGIKYAESFSNHYPIIVKEKLP